MCKYVINKTTNQKFSNVEFEEMNDSIYENMFKKNLPTKPFKDPINDRLAFFLYENPLLFKRLMHYKIHYGCFDPVFCENNIIQYTGFSYKTIFRNFFKSIDADIDYNKWQLYIGLAFARLSGKIYDSAGKD